MVAAGLAKKVDMVADAMENRMLTRITAMMMAATLAAASPCIC